MSQPLPDWMRLLPDGDHRWAMRLRRGEVRDYFAPRDATGSVLAERKRWLVDDPEPYMVLTPESEPALADTLQMAASLGVVVDRGARPSEQLLALAHVWEPDFVWTHPSSSGFYRLTGGVVCFPSSWALREKLGKPMHEIHEPVPGLNPLLAPRIDQFLASLTPGVAWTRENVGYARDAERNHHTSRPRQRLDGSIRPDEVWVRVEEQLLLKLAPSGSVLFGIRVDVYPLADVLRDEPARIRLIRSLETMTTEAAAYKGLANARETILKIARESDVNSAS
jgi:dimethylamine monooxygenase subunit A